MTRENYIRAVLDLYCGLPDTAARKPFPPDRRLAAQLFDQGLPLYLAESALLLASARRATRPPKSAPLAPIRSLAYFLPAIAELAEQPTDPGYLAYLRLQGDKMVKNSTDSGAR